MARIASGSTFTWIDKSQISDLSITASATPVVMIAASTDKGRDGLSTVSGSTFYKQYITNKKTMFAKHGQPLLQAAALIDSGATLLFNRIVAPDAKLANAIVSVTVTKTDAPNPNKLTLKFKVDTVADADSMATVNAHAATLLDVASETVKTFPLFAITDIGRGVSNKKFRLIPDYSTSKELSFMRYTMQVIEDTTILENIYFSMDQDLQYAGNNYGLDAVVKNNSSQIQSKTYETYIDQFVEFVSSILGTTSSELYSTDILFGCSRSGQKNTEIKIDPDTVNLNNLLGINIPSGSNGTFGDRPLDQAVAYEKALTEFFDGTATDEIYDVDKYQIDAIFDANYPDETKRAIEVLADYREDFMYFRDLGFVKTYDQIKAKAAEATPSRFSATYHNSYDVIDPYSKKQITVTIMYSLAKLFVTHFRNGKANPFEGILYGITFPDAIEGTVNYVPKKLPGGNQKQALVDINVNYISYYGSTLVMESQCTSQTENTQLSQINNVLAIQEVVKMLRVQCPKTRYTFIDEDGNGDSSVFENYKQDVQERLNEYKSNFKELTFEYVYDDTQVQNKVFYASIYFTLRNFTESEHFDLFAINSSSIVA